jgi:hypothetical protein
MTRLATVTALIFGFFVAGWPMSGASKERWHMFKIEGQTVFTCVPLGCPSSASVIVGTPGMRRYPVPESALNDPVFIKVLAASLGQSIGKGVVTGPFRRLRLGQHDGVFGELIGADSRPLAAYVSFHGGRAQEFLASAGTTDEAFEALADVVSGLPKP